MSVQYFPGVGWCDVCALPNGTFAFVHSMAGAVYLNGTVVAVPVDHLRYLRAASSPSGDVAAIGVGGNDRAYLIASGGWVDYGIVFGQNSVGIYFGSVGWVPVIQRTPHTWTFGNMGMSFPWPTSQGFRDVKPDGRIVYGDDAHVWRVEGVNLHAPMERGEITVGQIDGSDRIDGVGPAGRFTAIPGPAYEPHCADNGRGGFAVCARTPLGAAFRLLPPFPPVGDEPQPPVDPPVDPPVPPEPPMPSIPDQLERVKAIRRRLFPHLDDRDPINDLSQAFRITKTLAWELRDLGIGLVAAKPGSENNVEGYTADVVALRDGTHWDVLEASEEGAFAAWGLVPSQHNAAIVPRWRPPVDPGDVVDPEPQPIPPSDDLKTQIIDLRKRVLTHEGEIEVLKSVFVELKRQIDNGIVIDGHDTELRRRFNALVRWFQLPTRRTSREYGHAHTFTLPPEDQWR